MALAAGIIGSAHAEEAGDDAEMRRVFNEVLRDPTNIGLNFRYARLAASRGELRKALTAYERILARDPNNAEARREINRILSGFRPSVTRWTASFGAQYESNTRHTNSRFINRRSDDVAFTFRASVSDERNAFGERWRTDADVSTIYYTDSHDIDYGAVGARTGPLFDIASGLRLNPFVGVSYTWLQRRTFFFETSVGATLESDRTGALKNVSLRTGYQALGRSVSPRDGVFVEVYPRLVFNDLWVKEAVGLITPYWRYNGVIGSGGAGQDPFGQPFPSRSHQLGVRGDYTVRILENVTVNANVTLEQRHYYETNPGQSQRRRDFLVAPGTVMVVSLQQLTGRNIDLVLNYTYEYRTSNDGPQRYENHVVGARLIWRSQ